MIDEWVDGLAEFIAYKRIMQTGQVNRLDGPETVWPESVQAGGASISGPGPVQAYAVSTHTRRQN